jgi:hypothetical protein
MTDAFRQKWAVLFGATQYKNVERLNYCTRDIVEFGKTLLEDFEFEKDHVLAFGDFEGHETAFQPELAHEPKLTIFWEKLAVALKGGRIAEDDLLLFYFSGHGVRDPKDYLLPVDSTLNDLKHTAIEVEELVDQLTSTGCKNIVVFLDACREIVRGEKGALKGARALGGDESRELMQRKGVISFFSCDPEDCSYEIDELKHSSFTYCLLNALRSGDYRTVGEVYDYLLTEVPRINEVYKKRIQKPYAVIQPAEKRDLAIFASALKRSKSAEQGDDLIEPLSALVETNELDEAHYCAAVELIMLSKVKFLSVDEGIRLEWVKRLASHKVNARVFVATWDSKERRRPSAPITRKDLGKIR